MRKNDLRSPNVSNAALFVEEAALWARKLVCAEARGPGDYGNAMRRVARKIRVPWTALFNLHYRPPKHLAVEIYVALGEAANEQRNRYRDERARTVARTRLGAALLGAADALDRSATRMAGEEDGDLT